MTDADRLLDELAAIDAAGITDFGCIPLGQLTALDPARQANLLRRLIRQCGLSVPDARRLREIIRCVDNPGNRGRAHVGWRGGEARVYRGGLYLQPPPDSPPRPEFAAEVSADRPWQGPEGRIELVADAVTGIPESWAREGLKLAFRRGGERFRPGGFAHHKTLKQWFQEQRIVPWMRARVPLLFREDELVAVGDLAVAELPEADKGMRWRPVWTGHRRLR